MGLLFSKRHDFLTYEKSLEHIGQLQGKIVLRRGRRKAALQGCKQQLLTACLVSLVPCLAWVAYRRQGHWDHFSAAAYFSGTASPFLVPLVLYLMSAIMYRLLLLVDRHEEKLLRKLTEAKKKLVKELKDSTNFEKTMALLKKYDPEVQLPPPPPVPAPGALRQRNVRPSLPPGAMTQAPGGAPGAKGSATLLSSALDSVSALATNLMGDNPTLLEELRKAHTTAQKLQEENDALKQQLQQLCSKYGETPVYVALGAAGGRAAEGGAAAAEAEPEAAQGTTSSQPSAAPSAQSLKADKAPAAAAPAPAATKGGSEEAEVSSAGGAKEEAGRAKSSRKVQSSAKS